jgi:acyl-CoA dehydrogenase
VSTEGVRVMEILQECIGAKGFESDTYFEMALRDAQLIPGLEGSMHINLGLAVGFIPKYFDLPDATLDRPPSLIGGAPSRENLYLMEARTGSTHAVGFRPFLDAYGPLASVPNVAMFARQAEQFWNAIHRDASEHADTTDLQIQMAMGQCFATIVFGQLVAENAALLDVPIELTNVIFSLLVGDLSALALQLAAIPKLDDARRERLLKMMECPKTSEADWDFAGTLALNQCENP